MIKMFGNNPDLTTRNCKICHKPFKSNIFLYCPQCRKRYD